MVKNQSVEIAQGNCIIPKPDCFNPQGLNQLGVNPYNNLPTLSELAFDGRYCCGNNKASSNQVGGKTKNKISKKKNKGPIVKSKKLKKNTKLKTKLNKKKYNKNKTNKKKHKTQKYKFNGGQGYYLDLSSCPPGGLPGVKDYQSCCPPLFKRGIINVPGNTIQYGGINSDNMFKTSCSIYDGNLNNRSFDCKANNVKPICI